MKKQAVCDTCGNVYNNCIEIIKDNNSYTFDCFECAIQKLAPVCRECNCKIIGHGIEDDNYYYCCAHCAKRAGNKQAKDHV